LSSGLASCGTGAPDERASIKPRRSGGIFEEPKVFMKQGLSGRTRRGISTLGANATLARQGAMSLRRSREIAIWRRMTTVSATLTTAHGSRYLQQLCKHWSHKFAVEFTPIHGVIDLPLGRCILDAAAETLSVRLEPSPDADLERFESVVADHLSRFAFREELAFDWQAAA
jgi:hypothetical protein